jgi:hypothetical protein
MLEKDQTVKTLELLMLVFVNAFIFHCCLEKCTETSHVQTLIWITVYSWSAGLFQQVLPSSLADVEKGLSS